MPVFSYKCINVDCSNYEVIVKRVSFKFSSDEVCEICKKPLKKVYNFFNVSVKSSNSDSVTNIGKIIEEKNNSLKKKWEAYSYEQKSLREKISEKLKERKK
uniref:Uncharacterized protein n=1 Tax=Dictyoglomus turgidum TaxID=513050 RepID=A0A7C3SMQ1_9BACT